MGLFAWLVIHKHKAQMTTDRSHWACISSRMSAPLVKLLSALFTPSGLHPSTKRLRGPTNLWHLGSAWEKTSVSYCTVAKMPPPQQDNISYHRNLHMRTNPTSSISQSFLLLTILGNTIMSTITCMQAGTNETQHLSAVTHSLIYVLSHKPSLYACHKWHPVQIKSMNTLTEPIAPLIRTSYCRWAVVIPKSCLSEWQSTDEKPTAKIVADCLWRMNMQIKQAVNEKQSGGFGSSPFLRLPLNLALFKNTESLSILNSSQSTEGDMGGKKKAVFVLPCEPLSSFGDYCISHKLFSER